MLRSLESEIALFLNWRSFSFRTRPLASAKLKQSQNCAGEAHAAAERSVNTFEPSRHASSMSAHCCIILARSARWSA